MEKKMFELFLVKIFRKISSQGTIDTIGCTLSSVPMVFTVFNLGILGIITLKYPRAIGLIWVRW